MCFNKHLTAERRSCMYFWNHQTMRTTATFYLTLLILLLAVPALHAQYGRNGYDMYGRRQSIVPQTNEPQKKAEPMTAEEMVELEMPKITDAIGLNDFEQAVLKSILTKYVQQRIETQILDLGPEKTREVFESIQLKQDEELKASLSEDQYNALKEYQKNGGKKVKSKKEKRKKKKNSND